MPRTSFSIETQLTVFQRAAWRCQYCGEEVFLSKALEALNSQTPGHGYWHRNGRADQMAPLLLARTACVDHVVPVTMGGTNDLENLACACWSCNTDKSNQDPERWRAGRDAPRAKGPADGWDGFAALLVAMEPDSEWSRALVRLAKEESAGT